MTASERAVVRRFAEREGISEEEAATRLAQRWIERKVRKRTGKGPARVYSIKRKEKK